ncbi:MAG: hypothetical protein JWO86_6850 [Myxococcaceae bacterium]|nr:hypothetical protein [Myxococcaceae bacterium]
MLARGIAAFELRAAVSREAGHLGCAERLSAADIVDIVDIVDIADVGDGGSASSRAVRSEADRARTIQGADSSGVRHWSWRGDRGSRNLERGERRLSSSGHALGRCLAYRACVLQRRRVRDRRRHVQLGFRHEEGALEIPNAHVRAADAEDMLEAVVTRHVCRGLLPPCHELSLCRIDHRAHATL